MPEVVVYNGVDTFALSDEAFARILELTEEASVNMPRHHWALVKVVKEMGNAAHPNGLRNGLLGSFQIYRVDDKYRIRHDRFGRHEYVQEPKNISWISAKADVVEESLDDYLSEFVKAPLKKRKHTN